MSKRHAEEIPKNFLTFWLVFLSGVWENKHVQPTKTERIGQMQVTVTKGGEIYTMAYDPCHRQGVTEYYRELLVAGEIEGCLIDGEAI
jgi:hypothetical protein